MNIAANLTAMPFASPHIDNLKALNAFVAPEALRGFQRDILSKGHFTCICPFTGVPSSPDAHYVMPGVGVLYHFDGPNRYILTAASLKDGFPILCLVTAQDVVWVDKPERHDLVPLARQLLASGPDLRIQANNQPIAMIGDPNFAHFMWNEFPALIEAVDTTTDFSINLRFDPLGVMQGFARDVGLTLNHMTSPTQGRGWSAHPTVSLGSTICGPAAKAKLMALMKLPEPQKTSPRIWISVRDQGRTMENQFEYLRALIAAQSARAPETEFFFDGFSTPMDMNRQIYGALRPKFANRIIGAQSLIADLTAALPNARLTDMTGQPLSTAIGMISTCTFYISHTGTMQHKAAWFYPLKGVQHGNRTSLSPAALRWAAQMVDNAIVPAGVPIKLIKDTEVRGLPTQNDRNKDYIITDIAAAVEATLEQISGRTATHLAT